MVTNLQFAGVAAYLLWCLFSSLSGALADDSDDAECESDKMRTGRVAPGAPWVAGAGRESDDRAQDADGSVA